jgi:hypothetical protein
MLKCLEIGEKRVKISKAMNCGNWIGLAMGEIRLCWLCAGRDRIDMKLGDWCICLLWWFSACGAPIEAESLQDFGYGIAMSTKGEDCKFIPVAHLAKIFEFGGKYWIRPAKLNWSCEGSAFDPSLFINQRRGRSRFIIAGRNKTSCSR